MFAFVNWQNLDIVVALVAIFVTASWKLLQYSRCEEKQNSPQPQKRAACQVVRKKRASANVNDSEKSTDISGSDPITGDASTDGSDFDSPSSVKNGNKTLTSVRSPPGLDAPPGLAAPPGLEEVSKHTLSLDWLIHGNAGARLNPQAKSFVPSATGNIQADKTQRVRDSIHSLKESLQQFEGNPQDTWYPKKEPTSTDENTLSALRQAISNLSPQDAAVVRGFLRAKEEDTTETKWDVTNSHVSQRQDSNSVRTYGLHAQAANPAWQNHAMGVNPMQRPLAPRTNRAQIPSRKPLVEMNPKGDTLRSNLKDLATMDSNRVILVRGITRLGLDSAAALEGYFAKFGTIDRVMVSHSHCKTAAGSVRMRPATVGFVVMSSVDEAQSAFASGAKHVVQGVSVALGPFQSHAI